MCGRYTLIANAEAIRALFDLPEFDGRLAVPRYNIAPTQPIVVVRRNEWRAELGRELVPMRWGLIPAWTKDLKALPLLFNARSEGIAAKASFRNAFRRRRCLIPASGFYEWQARGKGAKQPFAIRPGSHALLAFAGLWETWSGADGSEIDTAAIITVPCNKPLSPIHERMPAIIAPADFEAWLSPENETAEAEALLRPAPDGLLTCAPVSTRVNAVANDDPGLWEEIAEVPAPSPPEPHQPNLF